MLVTPSDCGDITFFNGGAGNVRATNQVEFGDETARYQAETPFWGRTYARQGIINGPRRESAFVSPSLPFTRSEVPCPYDADYSDRSITCFGPNRTRNGPAWHMSTGPLDSFHHFGMNASPGDRVTWAQNATCAVVDAKNLTTAPYWRVNRYGGVDINASYAGVMPSFGPDLGPDTWLTFEIAHNLMYERTGFFSQSVLHLTFDTN